MIKTNAEPIVINETPIYYDEEFDIKIYLSQLIIHNIHDFFGSDEDPGTFVWMGTSKRRETVTRRISLSGALDEGAIFIIKDSYCDGRTSEPIPLMIRFGCDPEPINTPISNDRISNDHIDDDDDEYDGVYVDEPRIDLNLQNVEKLFDETVRNSVPPLSNDVLLFMRMSLNSSVAVAFGYKIKPWWMGGTLVYDDETDRCCIMAGRIFNRVMTQPDIVSRFQYTGLGLPGDDDTYDTILKSATLAVQCVAVTCGYTRETTPVATIYNDMKRAMTDEFRKRGLLVDFMVDAFESNLKERIEIIVDSIRTNL